MKVLYIATAYPRSQTDVITPWLAETISLLRQHGVEVTVLTSSYRGLGNQTLWGTPVVRFRYFPRKWEDLTHDETAVDRVKRGFLNKVKAACYMVGGSLATWRHCRKQRYDLIHVHWPLPHAVFGRIAARLSRAPMVISFHGAELMWVRHGARLLKPLLRWSILSADAITANSTHTVSAIQAIANRPVVIVPFGAAVGRFPNSAPPRRHDTSQILFVGRLVERKGVPHLLEAARILSAELPMHLHIVGSGPEEARLRALIAEKRLESVVTMHGQVSAEELHRHYLECDVFVLPAIFDSKGDTEGLGVVLIEAMSYRKPVVASGIGGIVDLVIDGQTGIRTPPADSPALAGAIRRLLVDPDLAQRLADGGYRHIERDYSWPGIISRLLGVYERLVSGRSTPNASRLTPESGTMRKA